MRTTEDANANYDVHPTGQVVGFSDILVALPFGATVVGAAPNRESDHVESSLRFKETHSLSALH